jgi:hypothetical protein
MTALASSITTVPAKRSPKLWRYRESSIERIPTPVRISNTPMRGRKVRSNLEGGRSSFIFTRRNPRKRLPQLWPVRLCCRPTL